MDNTYNDFKQASQFDKELCSLIAMEECSELVQAIAKAKRGKLDKANLSEEIADVLICMEWIKDIYNISNEDILEWYEYKIDRIVKRLNSGNFK